MIYSKEKTGLTQSQAVENLKAVLNSDYFRGYDCDSVRIYSDLVTADLRTSSSREDVRLKVADITDTVTNLLEVVTNNWGTLEKALVELQPSDIMLRSMGFEENLYKEGLELPITIKVTREGTTEQNGYSFSLFNLGPKESYFKSQGLNFRDAQKKVSKWYKELNRNLKDILPIKTAAQNPPQVKLFFEGYNQVF